MNNQDWINDMDFYIADVSVPSTPIQDEPLYTLSMPDFLNMPEVDFFELAKHDPTLQALLN